MGDPGQPGRDARRHRVGSAVDGKRIYVSASNSLWRKTELRSGETTNGGWWSALDAATGQILWETATPALQPPLADSVRGTPPPKGAHARTEGALTTANGINFGGDTAGYFTALDGLTGTILWRWNSGGSVIGAPAIVDGRLYWGSGYKDVGIANTKIYALGIRTAAP